MKTKLLLQKILLLPFVVLFSQCMSDNNKPVETQETAAATPNYGGYASKEQWGEHLVTICACNDCHTPKKMTPAGPVLDSSLLLSGHPANMPIPDVDRKAMEKKGLVVTQTLTAWVGPWGVSYTGNLTSDATGIGNWDESNFMTAIRHGKFKGIESGRTLLPPMPWEMYRNLTDDELKAIFAFLKSTKPIQNIVPATQPPATAMN